jgi:type IV pilus assembly protein PilO
MEIGLAKLPWYGQTGAFVLLALAGAAAFSVYYDAPARGNIAARKQQLAGLRADIDKSRAAAKRLPEFRTQVAELESRLQGLNAALPTEKDAADLLRRLQVVAVQSNLTIKGFKPSPPIDGPLHAEWPIALELDGTYHNLGAFFDRVGKFTRIINITALEVKAKGTPTPASTITASCVATAFVLTGKGKAAAATPAVPAAAASKPDPRAE